MKRRLPLGIALTAVILSIGITFVLTMLTMNKSYNSIIADFSLRSQQYEQIATVDALVRNNYYGEINEDIVNENMVSGYIEGLTNGQCMYLTAENYGSYKLYASGFVSGTGLGVYYDDQSGVLVVSAVDENSPAAQAGFKAGYNILSVGGKSITVVNADTLISKLTESISGKVSVVYTNGKSADEKTVKLSCGYEGDSFEYSVSDKVGYIKIRDFYDDTFDKFSEAIASFEEKSISEIIIDVRNNSSTNYDSVCDIIDMIVPVGTAGSKAIATIKDKNDETVSIRSSDSGSLSADFAVLVNDRTSGAGELLASDLKSFGKAKIFGERTAGNAKTTSVFELDDGSAIILTTGLVLPYVGDTFDVVGIEPDTVVTMSAMEKNTLDDIALANDIVYSTAFNSFS